MSDQDTSQTTPEPGPGRSRLWPVLTVILLLVIIALLAAAGWGGWRGWHLWQNQQSTQKQRFQTTHKQLGQVRSQVRTLQSQVDSTGNGIKNNQKNLTALQNRVNTLGLSLTDLNNAVRGGSQRVQLDEVEQLLLMANDQVQLAQDPATADKALAAADSRLAQLNSPRLFPLRKVISQERAALQAVQEPDITSASLALSQLIDALPRQPLRTGPHALKPATAKGAPAADKHQSWWSRGWQQVTSALRSLFHVRRTNQPIQPLLGPRQARLVGEVLVLRLDTARAALINRNTRLFHNELESAAKWIRHYYRADNSVVESGLKQLTKLSALDLQPRLPDISKSVEVLRKLRNNDAG